MLEDFFSGWFFQYFLLPVIIIVIILLIITKLFFNKPLGQVIMEWMGNRPLSFKDIDAQVHSRMIDECKAATRMSKDRNAKWLCIRAIDNYHYTTEGGMHIIGRIKGMATYKSHIEIQFREPWRVRKFIFIAPPDLILSSPSAKNIIFNGTSTKTIAVDFVYPTPNSGKYSEDAMDEFALLIYNTKRTIASDIMLQQLGENTLLASGSSTSQTRIQLEALRRHIYRAEENPVESQSNNV